MAQDPPAVMVRRRPFLVRLGDTGRSFAVVADPRWGWVIAVLLLLMPAAAMVAGWNAVVRLRTVLALWIEERRGHELEIELQRLRQEVDARSPTVLEVDTLSRRLASRYGLPSWVTPPVDAWNPSTLLDEMFPLRTEGSDIAARSRALARRIDASMVQMETMVDSVENLRRSWDREPSVLPARGRWSSGFGYRIHPVTGVWSFHHGVDLSNNTGTPVRATARGVVVETKYSTSYGNFVRIRHSDLVETLYAHLHAFRTAVGDTVERHQIIGLMGNTGLSAGPHVHYEVILHGKAVNPRPWILPQRIFP